LNDSRPQAPYTSQRSQPAPPKTVSLINRLYTCIFKSNLSDHSVPSVSEQALDFMLSLTCPPKTGPDIVHRFDLLGGRWVISTYPPPRESGHTRSRIGPLDLGSHEPRKRIDFFSSLVQNCGLASPPGFLTSLLQDCRGYYTNSVRLWNRTYRRRARLPRRGSHRNLESLRSLRPSR